MRFRKLEKAELFIVTVCEGEGVEENPCREIKYYMVEDTPGKYKVLYKEDWFEGDEGPNDAQST